MKNKNLLWIIVAVVVIAAIIGMVVFVLSGEDPEQPQDTLKLDGTWKVAANVQAGQVTLLEDQFIVIADGTASMYKDGSAEPYAKSAFTLTPSTKYPDQDMNLTEIGRKYTVSPVTDNYIRLYENASVYMELIRHPNEDRSPVTAEESQIQGKWNVVYRNNGQTVINEQLDFNNGTLKDYRDGGAEPVATVEYTWSDGVISVPALHVEMVCCPLNENVILLVEIGTGFVWEIEKIS